MLRSKGTLVSLSVFNDQNKIQDGGYMCRPHTFIILSEFRSIFAIVDCQTSPRSPSTVPLPRPASPSHPSIVHPYPRPLTDAQ